MNFFTSISDKSNSKGKVETNLMASYLRNFAFFVLSIFAVLVVGCYWVDPYGIWQTNNTYPRKVAASEKVRQIKSYQGLQYAQK